MKDNRLKTVLFTVAFFVLMFVADTSVWSQTTQPELCVSGICLGENEQTAKETLQGFSPRYDNELHQPKYFFYNQYGNQVMSVTGYSQERPFLIVGLEVFAVDESYQKKHYQMDRNFMTESGFFIGLRPSATSMVFGIPNTTGPKEVIKKKGQPVADEKPEKLRVLRYKLNEVGKLETEAKADRVNFGSYTAEYRFYKNNLRHFILTMNTAL